MDTLLAKKRTQMATIGNAPMKRTAKESLIAVALLGALAFTNAHAQKYSSAELDRRTIERRGVEAAIWGMPIIEFDALRQAYFRDSGANYGDVIFWSRPGSWKLQTATPNTTIRYLFAFTNTRKEGPIVIDIPATGDASLMGTFIDAWQVPLTDLGLAGEDLGKGGKYLLLPPDHRDAVPEGYIPVPMNTYNGFLGMRVNTKSEGAADVAKALAYLRQIRIYPLSKSGATTQTRFVDMADTIWDGVTKFDDSLYASLARMLDEEPAQPRDSGREGMLSAIGIERGKEFKPDQATRTALAAAAEEAHAWLMNRLVTLGGHYWEDGKWDLPVPPIGPKSGFTWEADGILDSDARGVAFFSFFCPPKKLGAGQVYLVTFFDKGGERLRGGETYRLRVSADVPASQYWSVTVYEHATAALFRDVSRPSLDSFDTKAKKNADGSVDVYFGPSPPAGMEANWVPTVSGKDWFPYFRLYGPQQPFFAKTWKLADIEKVTR